MSVTITAAGIGALCTVLILLTGAAVFAVKAIVAAEIRNLNGRYVYSLGSKITGHEIERWMDKTEADIRGLQAGA